MTDDFDSNNEIVGTKSLLFNYVNRIPGIRYRELLRLTNLSNGVLSYHLKILENTKKIIVKRQNRITRYYPINLSEQESSIISCMRQKGTREIAFFILEHDRCSFTDIVEYTKKSPSSVSWHIKRLRESEMIVVSRNNCKLKYRITSVDMTKKVLNKYNESFVDKVVDNYLGMVQDL